MAQGEFTKQEAGECVKALNEIMTQAVTKKKTIEFIGHFNDLFLFLSAAKEQAPDEEAAK